MRRIRNRNSLWVGGVALPTPSIMTWGLQDLSVEGAGRTQDGIMHKGRFAQKRKISLAWHGVSNAHASEILQAFNPEYISVAAHDPMAGGVVTRTYYVGDRSGNFKRILVGENVYDVISFDIIER